jgi:DNA-directed RNA polymerase specialized sigma24 family protein
MDLTEEELSLARSIAVASQRKYEGYVEADDVAQELCLWMLEHEAHMEDWRELEIGFSALRKTLIRQAYEYCEAQRAWRVGYAPHDNAGYSREALRELLALWGMQDDWPEGDGVDGRPHAVMTAGVADVTAAINRLDEKWQDVLYAAIAEGFDYPEIARIYSTPEETITAEAVRKRVERALTKLQKELSSWADFVDHIGSRQVMPNIRAQAIIRQQEKG